MSADVNGLPNPDDARFMLGLATWLSGCLTVGGLTNVTWVCSEHLLGDRGVRETVFDADFGPMSLRLIKADTVDTQGKGKARVGIQLITMDGSVADSLWSGGFGTDTKDAAVHNKLSALCAAVEVRLAEARVEARQALLEEIRQIF